MKTKENFISVFPSLSLLTSGAIPKQMERAATIQTIPITVRLPIAFAPVFLVFCFFICFLSAYTKNNIIAPILRNGTSANGCFVLQFFFR